MFVAGAALAHLQVEQRGPRPHSFADLQVVLLSGEARRALVVWRQHFDVHRGNGRPAAGGQRRGENVSRQTGETPARWMEPSDSQILEKDVGGRKELKGREKNSWDNRVGRGRQSTAGVKSGGVGELRAVSTQSMGTPSTAAAVREAWRRNKPLTFAPLHPLPLPEDLLLPPHLRAAKKTGARAACDTVRRNTVALTGCFHVMSRGSDGGQEVKKEVGCRCFA